MPRAKSVAFSLCLVACLATPAVAAKRTYVSAKGSDANPCTLPAPCRTFATAVATTAADGEVIALDSGSYGPVTIDKGLSLIAPDGVYAGILATTGYGVLVSAGGTDKVTLRGLAISGQGTGTAGIHVTGVGALTVDHCTVTQFVCTFLCGNGITFAAPNAALVVKDSTFDNNHYGIGIYNSSGNVRASIDRVRADGNGVGFDIGPQTSGTVDATITNSTASSNGVGFSNVDHGGASRATVNLDHCVAANNTTAGISTSESNAASETRISNCTITGASPAVVKNNSGVLYTRQNNMVQGAAAAATFLSPY